jgi:hypothetical protein
VPGIFGTSVNNASGSGKTSPYSPIETAHDLTGELDVRHLVDADRHPARLVNDHIGRLQDWVTEEAVVDLCQGRLVVALDQAELARVILDRRVA